VNSHLRQTVCLLLFSTMAHAEQTPIPGSLDTRIRTAIYNPDEVYRVTGRVGYQLSLEFGADESFVGLAAGDGEALAFESQGNHLFLKPRATRVVTNLTILTTRHHYYLEYRVEAAHIDPEGNTYSPDPFYALRFSYPLEEIQQSVAQANARAEAARIDSALAQTAPVLNADYQYCGPRALKPTTVTDDGVQTRFTFGARTELPAIFTRADDGTESLVNFTVTSDAILVHRIAPAFVLRRGRLVACVRNQHFSGAGQRLDTGTVSPDITRLTPQVTESLR
jgi:type IV secretion system protein VirB9